MTEEQNKKTLNLYPIDYPFETLINRIEKDKLILDPDFQRKYKWDKDGWERASKFIESCLMRIPLPSCYFAEDEETKHIVIDGVQRLTTIKRFFNDEFALEGMTVFKELEGKFFSEIGQHKAELEATTIRCIILRKENPKKLTREIFSRLNQGAVQLSNQEIRHALYPGSLDKLLTELSQNPVIENFGLGKNSERTKDAREGEEQVLRFFAFTDDPQLENYDNVLKTFLDDYMEKHSEMSEEQTENLRKKFNLAIQNSISIFPDTPFINTSRERQKQGVVYYDLLMPTIGRLDSEIVKNKEKEIKAAYDLLCESDDFGKTLSGGLQSKTSILKRNSLWDELLQEAIKDA